MQSCWASQWMTTKSGCPTFGGKMIYLSRTINIKGKVTPNKEDDQLKEVQLSIKQQKGSGGRENIFFNIMQVFELNQVNDKKPPRKVATYKKAKERKRKGQVKVREAFYGSQIEKENYKSN